MATEQHLVYRSGDWLAIAGDLPVDCPLTRHLKDKARAVSDHASPCQPFGETVSAAEALEIRKVAQLRGMAEVRTGEGE